MKERYVIEFYNHTKKDFDDVWNIEYNYLEQETISSVEQVMLWDRKNRDIHIFVRDAIFDCIVGEMTLLPLTDKQFIDFMKNELSDTELNYKSLEAYEDNNTYNLLISAVAIDKKYRGDKLVLSYLLKGMNKKINDLMSRGIKFKNMCAEGQTLDGQKFIKNFLNLKEKCITKEGYKLYSFDDEKEILKWYEKFPVYIEEYDRKRVMEAYNELSNNSF